MRDLAALETDPTTWLRLLLHQGPLLATAVIEAARSKGFRPIVVLQAKLALGIQSSTMDAIGANEGDQRPVWFLPDRCDWTRAASEALDLEVAWVM